MASLFKTAVMGTAMLGKGRLSATARMAVPFLFLGGNRRRAELPKEMRENVGIKVLGMEGRLEKVPLIKIGPPEAKVVPATPGTQWLGIAGAKILRKEERAKVRLPAGFSEKARVLVQQQKVFGRPVGSNSQLISLALKQYRRR
ncbi:MAG: hypothetical protein NTY90_02985 [Candidatus Micrarchaeota archaeon]|nr:hypothetical protein [Candidatus Micrarchaeota archaeon]